LTVPKAGIETAGLAQLCRTLTHTHFQFSNSLSFPPLSFANSAIFLCVLCVNQIFAQQKNTFRMLQLIRIASLLLLAINGIGALYGGFRLIADPTGASMQMPLSYLEHSPFSSYLIPGIVLFLVNGCLSIWVIILLLRKAAAAPLLVMAQGTLLSGWILVQMAMLRMFYPPLHLTFLLMGVCLFGCGVYLRRHKAEDRWGS